MFGSPFRRALARGLASGGLEEELGSLGGFELRMRKDARALCGALDLWIEQVSRGDEPTFPVGPLVGIFEDVVDPDVPAFLVLLEQGVPRLIRVFDLLVGREEDQGYLLVLLKVLAMYGTPDGIETIVAAARRPLEPNSHLWIVILSMFTEAHPFRDELFASLSDPLPRGIVAMALLDAANESLVAGCFLQHPFDSEAGLTVLRGCLEDEDPEHECYATSATTALPFLEASGRDELLAIAAHHRGRDVRMEAAWAQAKLEREEGLEALARFCVDVNTSARAIRYLEDLGCEERVPAEARSLRFQAQAEFAEWLAHPNELGRSPDELHIVDERTLRLPSSAVDDRLARGRGSRAWLGGCSAGHARQRERILSWTRRSPA